MGPKKKPSRKDPSNDCVVTVTIELGHQANFLKEPSPEGFTHDWTVFVRGYEGSRLEYFVEKVVFKLHKTFKSPMRVISEPPFRVTESGYAGFILPIEIHFRNKQTPRKILFSYDLFLNAKDSPPINNVRYEKLKFQNPTPEFKAKLIKAGGSEQGAEQVPYDLFGSPVKSEKKALPKIPKDKDKERDKERDKEKEKIKIKKSSPHPKSASPARSLSSLSSTSSDDDDDNYTVPLPPPPPKKEKEPSLKKESSSSLPPQPKQESSSSSSTPSASSSSSHKEKSKHRSSSSNSSHRERSDKDSTNKPHKHKEKDKERHANSSHKDKEGVKKERSSNSHKIPKDHLEVRKDRESSISSGKSTSSQHDNKLSVQMFQKEKEKSTHSKDKDTSSSSSKEKSNIPGKERDKTSSKEKHFSHKDVSPATNSEAKKVKEETGKEKSSKERDRHDKKSHKRPMELAEQEDDAEKKKLKKSSSVAGIDDKSMKPKSTSGKEKSVPRESKEKESAKESKEKESTKESKDKTPSKSSSSSGKIKHEKIRHSEKPRHNHSSESKPKEPSSKHPEMPQQKQEKVSKSETLTQSERLAMTADFQPQLLLSPLKSKSDEEASPTPSPVPVEERQLKRSTSNSSPSSQSSHVSCDDANKSDHEMLEPHTDVEKHIVSGLTDSDSDSEDEPPYSRSSQKELKSILNKHGQQVPHAHKNSSHKLARRVSLEEKQKKMEHEPTDDGLKKHNTSHNKHSKEEKRPGIAGENKSSKAKYFEPKMECSDDEVNVEQVSAPDNTNNQGCNGLGILAPNGISIGELIAINEKIEKAQLEENRDLLEKVIHVIGETDDFDINDVALSFDICSIEKRVVLQIQAVLREY